MKYISSLMLLLFFSINLFAQNKKDIPPNQYNAIAVPIVTSTIKYPYEDEMPGIIIYTAKPGTILRGATYSSDGKLVKNGDILIKYKDNRRNNIYKVRKQELINSEAALKFAKEDLIRYKKLMKKSLDGKAKNIISKSTYQLALSNFLKVQADVEKAKVQVIRAENWLKLTTEYAYFDCIVTEVFMPLGLCAFEDNIMTLAQLNPMGIEIKVTREEVYGIPENVPLKIYPFNCDEPIETYGFSKIVSTEGIILRVKNDPIPPQIPDKYKDIPTITQILPVERFSVRLKDAGMAVPKVFIHNDSKGKYVWKASINDSFNTKAYRRILLLDTAKIYVKPSDEQRYITPHHLYIRLADAGSLKINDYILGKDLPENLDKYNQVIFYKRKYTFSPGDPVKVVVEP
jgi:hypothetical protein